MSNIPALVVSSDLSNVSVVLAFVRSQCERAGLDDDAVFACELATDEACANIIEHAYEGRTDGRIQVTCQRVGGRFVVRFHDQGQRFDPGQVARPVLAGDLWERSIGGLGLHFMYSVMDEVHFEFDDAGNTLTMVKLIASPMGEAETANPGLAQADEDAPGRAVSDMGVSSDA